MYHSGHEYHIILIPIHYDEFRFILMSHYLNLVV